MKKFTSLERFQGNRLLRKLTRLTQFTLLLLLIGCLQATAQQRTVSGTITNDSAVALQGVTVAVKGQKISTVTNETGAFTLQVPANARLVVSYAGYGAQEIAVGNQSTVNFQLKAFNTELEQVVVVGFGTQKKVNLTGAVSTVSAKALADRPVQNALQSLQGLVTGLNISQNNGSLETNPTINIRGTTAGLGNSSSSPLILIDGMEGSLTAINPQDIETISVLKDAAAAAVYGSRAAYGVVLVTTKRGKAGKVQFNYNNNFRSTKPVFLPRQMDSYTFALFWNDGTINANSAPFFNAAHLQRIKDYQSGTITTSIIKDPNNANRWADGYAHGNANVDWYRTMFKEQAFSQEHNLSVSGGNEKTTFYLSGNYMPQGGFMKFNTDTYNRYGITAKVNSKITDQIAINYSTRYIHEGYQRPAQLTNSFYQDLGRQGWPTLPLYDPNGHLFSSPSPALGMAQGGIDNNQRDWNYQQLQLVLEPIKGWKTFGEFNYRSRTDFRHYDVQKTYNYDVNNVPYEYNQNSEVFESGYKENYFNTNMYSEYSRKIANKHTFKVLGGFQSELFKNRDVNANRRGIIVPSLATIATTSGVTPMGTAAPPNVGGGYNNWGIQGFFGRINYDFDGRYLIEGNLRYDGSSRFRTDKRWNLNPSISAGWNVAREAFFSRFTGVVNTLKFRASYGQLGNQNTNVFYPTYQTLPVGSANGTWLVGGAQPNTASAPNLISTSLTWERVKSYNAGVDFSLLRSRLTGSFDLFKRITIGLVNRPLELPAVLGVDANNLPSTNNTDLKTTGFEMEIAWNDQLKNGLSYSLRFLVSDYQSTILKFPSNPIGLLNNFRVGQRLGDIYGYTTIGIAKTKAEMDAHLGKLSNGQSFFGSQWEAGDIMYADYNGDGKIDAGTNTQSNSGDFHLIGNSTPRYTVGFDASANWKGFDVRGFFQGVMKRDIWQGSYFFWGATNNIYFSTGFVEHKDYFRADPAHPLGQNLDSYYPRPNFGSGKNQQVQTRYLQDASYLRLKNLQLGYTLPASLVKKAGIQRLRFYVSGENLLTMSKVATMFDPETIDGGSGGNVYPLQKVLSAGLTVTF